MFLEPFGTIEWYYTRAPTIPHITRSNHPLLISEWFSRRRARGVRTDPTSGNAVIKWPFFLAMIKDARLDYIKSNRTTAGPAVHYSNRIAHLRDSLFFGRSSFSSLSFSYSCRLLCLFFLSSQSLNIFWLWQLMLYEPRIAR